MQRSPVRPRLGVPRGETHPGGCPWRWSLRTSRPSGSYRHPVPQSARQECRIVQTTLKDPHVVKSQGPQEGRHWWGSEEHKGACRSENLER